VSSRRSWTLAVAVCAVALSGCGGGGPQTTTPLLHGGQAPTVDVYWSLPSAGPGRRQVKAVIDGINLALAQRDDTANFYRVDLIPLVDSDAGGRPDPALVARHAMRVADDPHAVLYIGDWASEASEISIPILNQAGIPQISPASTYIGLTSALPNVTAPNEPSRYYPSQTRTFLRLVPPGPVEAAADLQAANKLGCRHVAIGHDADPLDGSGIASLILSQQRAYNVDVVNNTPVNPSSPGSWIASLKREQVDCVIYAGDLADGGTLVAEAVHAALATAKIIGTDGVCTGAWTTGLPPSIDRSLWCTAPAPSLTATAAGRAFLALYRAKYPKDHASTPDPAAVYGYEAMKLGLDTIAALGAQGNIKADVLSTLFATREPDSPIGTYGFNRDGETTLRSYGLYQFKRGAPVFWAALTPSHVQ
jgi:branched-chain amino acid transport system substrate-binding protein